MDGLILSFASEPDVGMRRLGSSLRGLEEGLENEDGHGAAVVWEKAQQP